MSNLHNNGENDAKTTFVPLAEDDRVWIYRTSDPNDLVELITDPFEWVSHRKVRMGKGKPMRGAVLLDHFVITLDVATSVPSNPSQTATYAIDGIDMTGLVMVRMATAGGRFDFKSKFDYAAIEKRLLAQNPEFVLAQSSERAYVHLPLGTDIEFRTAFLCAAIENQDWLCSLYGKMNVMMLDADGNVKEGRKLTFKMLGPSRDMGILSQAPRLDVIYQGTGPVTTINPLAAASGTPTGNYDACNAGGGTLIQNTFYMDTFVIKAYAPDPTPGG